MRSVKNKGTMQELFIRDLLCKLGFNRYRLSTSQLECTPDIVYPGQRKAIFINGCFWHGHDCSRGKLPTSNTEFWKNKIAKNKERDEKNYLEISVKGWTYLVIWQCEIKKKNIPELERQIKEFMNQ